MLTADKGEERPDFAAGAPSSEWGCVFIFNSHLAGQQGRQNWRDRGDCSAPARLLVQFTGASGLASEKLLDLLSMS